MIYRPYEIARTALLIENNSMMFYSALAQRAGEGKIRDLLETISREEKEHYQIIFEQLHDKFYSWKIPENCGEEYEEQLWLLAEAHLLTRNIDPDGLLEAAGTVAKAVDLAVSFERDTVAFYLHLKTIVPREEQAAVERIIEEEKRQLRDLLALKARMEGVEEKCADRLN